MKVTNVDGNKLWMKIMFEKRRGRLTRLMEALSAHGLELNDVSVTTSMGATLVSSCIQVINATQIIRGKLNRSSTIHLYRTPICFFVCQGTHGELLEASTTSKLLQEIVERI